MVICAIDRRPGIGHIRIVVAKEVGPHQANPQPVVPAIIGVGAVLGETESAVKVSWGYSSNRSQAERKVLRTSSIPSNLSQSYTGSIWELATK